MLVAVHSMVEEEVEVEKDGRTAALVVAVERVAGKEEVALDGDDMPPALVQDTRAFAAVAGSAQKTGVTVVAAVVGQHTVDKPAPAAPHIPAPDAPASEIPRSIQAADTAESAGAYTPDAAAVVGVGEGVWRTKAAWVTALALTCLNLFLQPRDPSARARKEG